MFATTQQSRVVRRLNFLKIMLISTGLFACADSDVSDLQNYIQEVNRRPAGKIQPLPEEKVIEPFIFNPDGLRNPFRPLEKMQDQAVVDHLPGSGVRPDTTRRKEELESYSLDSLRMVGTLNMQDTLWALIKASDGTIHRVKKGNYMGRNYGEIIRILDNRIELMEIVPDKPGTWREQQASMALAE
jgi:type IV pilus assembly protein PilP